MISSRDINYKNTHFEYPELMRIHDEPSTTQLITLKREVSANALSVNTSLGGGQYGHLGLISPTAAYSLLPNTQPYVRPTNPGPINVPQNATQFQIAQLQDQHEEATHRFREVLAVEQTLTQQIVAALDQKFLKAIRHPATNKITCSIPDIFNYLFDTYRNIYSFKNYTLITNKLRA